MNNWKTLTPIFIFLCLMLSAGLARAVPCLPGDVEGLVGTTCEIGDKTFTFTSDFNVSQGQFLFTPDASDALSPAFTISGTYTLSAPNQRSIFGLGFNLSTTNGASTLSGLDVTVTGLVAGGTPTDSGGGGTIVDAANESDQGLFPEACIQSGGGFSACLRNATSASATGSFATPISSEVGFASWLIATDATGTATFLSATYAFDQIAQAVPQPATLALLGIALAGLGFSRRRPFMRR